MRSPNFTLIPLFYGDKVIISEYVLLANIICIVDMTEIKHYREWKLTINF